MTERPDDPQDETTPRAPDAGDAEGALASGTESAPGAGEVTGGTGVPPAPEESPATAPDESAAPVELPPAVGGEEAADDAPVTAAPETEPAPARRRDAERPAGGAPVQVKATAKYVRTSARKARLVCDHIRGKSVAEARAILAFTPRAAAKDWAKLLESAVANAEHNHELVGEQLRIASVYADEGPTLKRYRPRAMGRATRIRKRTSHLTITLTPKES